MSRTYQDSASINRLNYQPGSHARPFLIALTVTALVSGPLLVLEIIWPEQPWRLLLIFFTVIAVESVLTTLWLKKSKQIAGAIRIRVAELLVILFLLRLFTWLITSSLPGRSDIYRILLHPETVFDGFFLFVALLTFFVVFRAQSLTHQFTRLSLDRSEFPASNKPGRSSTLGDEYSPLIIDRKAILQNYYRDWAIGGSILIICAAVSTFDFAEITSVDSGFLAVRSLAKIGLQPEMLAALIFYLLGGFLLASEGRLAMLNARWTYEGVKTENRIFKLWRWNSLFLLFIIALTAALIPISSTIDISGLIQTIGWIAFLIVGLILTVLSAIYFFLLSGLMSITPIEQRSPLELKEVVPDIPQLASLPSEISSLILGSMFWIILLAAIVISMVFLVRTIGKLPRRSSLSQWWRHFLHWLRRQWHRLTQHVQIISNEVRSKIPTLEQPIFLAPSSWRFFRLSSLSPRDKVRYFYLSTVKRAGSRAVLRKDGETPSEYTRDLQDGWPGISDEIDELTSAFIRARYSGQFIENADAESVKPIWKRIKAAFKR